MCFLYNIKKLRSTAIIYSTNYNIRTIYYFIDTQIKLLHRYFLTNHHAFPSINRGSQRGRTTNQLGLGDYLLHSMS